MSPYLNVLSRICSKNPDFDLVGCRLEASFVRQSLMHPLTPLPHPSTPPSLFPAAEAFEDVPTGMVASEPLKDTPKDHGKAMFFY